MKMKVFFILAIIGASTSLLAQPKGNKRDEIREKIHAEKVAFIATELALTPEEAKTFWPIYNKYEAELDAIRDKRRDYHRQLRKLESQNSTEAYSIYEGIFATEKLESDVRLKYLKLFADHMGKEKSARVFIAEDKFKRELMKKFKNDHPFGPPPGE